MKQVLTINIILLLTLIFSSCDEYEYEKPLTSLSKATIDTNAVGLWIFDKCKTYNNFRLDIDSHMLLILPYNKKEYIILFINSTNKQQNDLPLVFKGHVSKFGNYYFANVRWISDKNDVPYTYYAFTIQNDSLYYWGFLKNKVPYQFNAKKFFTKNYNDTNYISAVRKYKKFKISSKIFPTN